MFQTERASQVNGAAAAVPPLVTPKVRRLVEVAIDTKAKQQQAAQLAANGHANGDADNDADGGWSCIVFVQRKAAVLALSELLKALKCTEEAVRHFVTAFLRTR